MRKTILFTLAVMILAAPALAHPGHVASGFLHPLTGLDHLTAEFSFGGMPAEDAEVNLRLFADRVMPILQRDPAFRGGGEPQALKPEDVVAKKENIFAPA